MQNEKRANARMVPNRSSLAAPLALPLFRRHGLFAHDVNSRRALAACIATLTSNQPRESTLDIMPARNGSGQLGAENQIAQAQPRQSQPS